MNDKDKRLGPTKQEYKRMDDDFAKMDGETYIKNVLRTESTDFDAVRERLTDNIIRLDHMAHGIMTEISELFGADQDDVVNLVEELGDVTWYVSGAIDVFRCWGVRVFLRGNMSGQVVSWNYLTDGLSLFDKKIDAAIRRMALYAGDFLDQLKKHIFYGKPIDVESSLSFLREVIRGVQSILTIINAQHGKSYTLEDVWYINIAKLQKRYSGKFSEDAANNRDLEAERAVLEAGGEPDLIERYKMIAGEDMTEDGLAYAVDCLRRKVPVNIYFSDESGPDLWVVSPEEHSGFWLEGFEEQEEAIEWCRMYGMPNKCAAAK